MATLLTAVVFVLAIPFLLFVMVYFARDLSKQSPIGKFLSTTEMDEVKKYATMFGLDNEMDINVEELLAMGRKYEEFLGTEKVNEIVELTKAAVEVHYEYHHETRVEHHRINVIMKAQELVAVEAPSFIVTTTKILGGDRNGEPTSL